VCQLHPDGSHCVGCFRTTEEIAAWPGLGELERRDVLARLEQRRAARREQRRALRGARRSLP